MPSSTASCTQRTASPSTATPCANHQKNPPSVASLTLTTPSEPLKPSMGAAVRDHRNAVRNRSESPSAIAGIRTYADPRRDGQGPQGSARDAVAPASGVAASMVAAMPVERLAFPGPGFAPANDG